MTIEVQLFATLARYLPPAGRDGSATIEVPAGTTVGTLVEELGIPRELATVALINGHEADPEQPLAAGDVVALFPPLAGG